MKLSTAARAVGLAETASQGEVFAEVKRLTAKAPAQKKQQKRKQPAQAADSYPDHWLSAHERSIRDGETAVRRFV